MLIASPLLSAALIVWAQTFEGFWASAQKFMAYVAAAMVIYTTICEAAKMLLGFDWEGREINPEKYFVMAVQPIQTTLPFEDEEEASHTTTTPEETAPEEAPQQPIDNDASHTTTTPEETTPEEIAPEEAPQQPIDNDASHTTTMTPEETTPEETAPEEAPQPQQPIEEASHTTTMTPEQQFQALTEGILTPTDETMKSLVGTWRHYEGTAGYRTNRWFNDDLKAFLLSIGFELHHESRDSYQMNDVVMSHPTLLCQFSCVRGYYGVLFHQSREALDSNIAGALAHFKKIYGNPLRKQGEKDVKGGTWS